MPRFVWCKHHTKLSFQQRVLACSIPANNFGIVFTFCGTAQNTNTKILGNLGESRRKNMGALGSISNDNIENDYSQQVGIFHVFLFSRVSGKDEELIKTLILKL